MNENAEKVVVHLKNAQHLVELAILMTPTSAIRNSMAEINVRLFIAIEEMEDAK